MILNENQIKRKTKPTFKNFLQLCFIYVEIILYYMYSTVFRYIVNLQLSTIIFNYLSVQMLIDQTVQHLH